MRAKPFIGLLALIFLAILPPVANAGYIHVSVSPDRYAFAYGSYGPPNHFDGYYQNYGSPFYQGYYGTYGAYATGPVYRSNAFAQSYYPAYYANYSYPLGYRPSVLGSPYYGALPAGYYP